MLLRLFIFLEILFIHLADQSRVDPDSDSVYLCGHSLGLQPKRVRKSIDAWLKDWAEMYGYFEEILSHIMPII